MSQHVPAALGRPSRRINAILLSAAAALVLASAPARGQTTSALFLSPWTHDGFGETLDRLHYQAQTDVRGSGNQGDTTQIFFWDSTGRFRLAPTSGVDPRLGYRYLTITTDSNSPGLPDTLDDLSLAAGLRLGEWQGGQLSLIAGAGYSGDNLFADSNGLYGVGHLIWEKPAGGKDRFIASIDYDGSNAFLPDVPLPGFGFIHDGPGLSWMAGFPRSELMWAITPQIGLSASYAVPFTADVTLQYRVADHVSLFGAYADVYHAFYLDDEPRTDRFFFHQQRVEAGVRYTNDNLLGRGITLDAALTVGYAFDQNWSRGFDVRSLDPIGSTDATPYVGLTLWGRF